MGCLLKYTQDWRPAPMRLTIRRLMTCVYLPWNSPFTQSVFPTSAPPLSEKSTYFHIHYLYSNSQALTYLFFATTVVAATYSSYKMASAVGWQQQRIVSKKSD